MRELEGLGLELKIILKTILLIPTLSLQAESAACNTMRTPQKKCKLSQQTAESNQIAKKSLAQIT